MNHKETALLPKNNMRFDKKKQCWVVTTKKEDLKNRAIEALKECYRNSKPSLNLDSLPPYKEGEKKLNPNNYTLSIEKFDKILAKHNVKLSETLYLFLNKSPKLIAKAGTKK